MKRLSIIYDKFSTWKISAADISFKLQQLRLGHLNAYTVKE